MKANETESPSWLVAWMSSKQSPRSAKSSCDAATRKVIRQLAVIAEIKD